MGKKTNLVPTGECWCGCGQSNSLGSFFVSGHDKRAESAIVKVEYGTVPDLLDQHGHGPGKKNASEALTRTGAVSTSRSEGPSALRSVREAAAARPIGHEAVDVPRLRNASMAHKSRKPRRSFCDKYPPHHQVSNETENRMTLRTTAIATTVALLIITAAASVTAALADAPAPGPNEVNVGVDTGESNTLVANGIKVTDQPFDRRDVLLSVKLPDVASTEQIRVRTDFSISRCSNGDISGGSSDPNSPCRGMSSETPYNPSIHYRLFEASSATATSGNAISSDWRGTVCTASMHHCDYDAGGMTLNSPTPGTRFINLVISVDDNGGNARPGDVVEVEAENHSRLSVVRLGANRKSESDPSTADSSEGVNVLPVTTRNDPQWRVVYSRQLTGLSPGEVIDAASSVNVGLGSYNYDPLVVTEMILVRQESGKQPTDGDPAEMSISAKNGSNCGDRGDGCVFKKATAARVGNNVPGTMYLNVVAFAQREGASGAGNDNVQVKAGGELKRVKYAP